MRGADKMFRSRLRARVQRRRVLTVPAISKRTAAEESKSPLAASPNSSSEHRQRPMTGPQGQQANDRCTSGKRRRVGRVPNGREGSRVATRETFSPIGHRLAINGQEQSFDPGVGPTLGCRLRSDNRRLRVAQNKRTALAALFGHELSHHPKPAWSASSYHGAYGPWWFLRSRSESRGHLIAIRLPCGLATILPLRMGV